jgi:hypothetical protein
MQADFTDQPEGIPELVKRFEGGADIVVADRVLPDATPADVRKLHQLAGWLPRLWPIRAAVTVPGVQDPFGTFRLLRIAVLRDLLKQVGERPMSGASDPWQANLDLLQASVPFARRVESVALPQRYDVRQRASRRDPWPDAWALLREGWRARRRPRAGSAA